MVKVYKICITQQVVRTVCKTLVLMRDDMNHNYYCVLFFTTNYRSPAPFSCRRGLMCVMDFFLKDAIFKSFIYVGLFLFLLTL